MDLIVEETPDDRDVIVEEAPSSIAGNLPTTNISIDENLSAESKDEEKPAGHEAISEDVDERILRKREKDRERRKNRSEEARAKERAR